ncbi:MAG: protein phosphatase 2C domain-containing protein [Bacteroidetes bacterium]|nr:protein phosphatase 2C domain-containing protein [Fibrella sp.]
MNTTLRDYLITRLPEPLSDANRLAAFFDQPEVIACMDQIEQLTGELTSRWQQEPAAPPRAEPAVAEQRSSVTADLPEPAEDNVEPAFSFLASEAEVERAIQSGQTADDPNAVSPIYELAPVPQPAPDAASQSQTPNAVISDSQPVNESIIPQSTVEVVPTPPVGPVVPQPATDAVTLPSTPDAVRFPPTNQPESPAPQPLRAVSIPNATVGKPYAHRFDFGALGLPEPASHTLDLDTVPGLTYDPEARILSGTPTEAGEFSFGLSYRTETGEPDPARSRRIQLLINPDPRSLWKDLPSDTTDPYYKADAANELLSVGDMRLLAASVRGRSHAHEGKFRDDDFGLSYLAEAGWYLLTVADGAGSAPYARKGAQLACQTVTEYLHAIDPQSWSNLTTVIDQYQADQPEPVAGALQRQLYDVLGKAVFAAYKAIEAEAQTKTAEPKDFATTLITVLARPVGAGWFVGAFWVGDGGVGIYHTDREPVLLGTPDGGEYAGQTRFLTMSETISNNFFGRFTFALVTDFTALVLMTDGVTDPKFQTDGNLSRKVKWDELWADLNHGVSFTDDALAPAQLQDWLTFWSPGNHDDRTIALLYTHASNPKN